VGSGDVYKRQVYHTDIALIINEKNGRIQSGEIYQRESN
jgi:hypothetical protein